MACQVDPPASLSTLTVTWRMNETAARGGRTKEHLKKSNYQMNYSKFYYQLSLQRFTNLWWKLLHWRHQQRNYLQNNKTKLKICSWTCEISASFINECQKYREQFCFLKTAWSPRNERGQVTIDITLASDWLRRRCEASKSITGQREGC